MNTKAQHYRARSFGLLWQSDIPIEHFAAALSSDERADIIVRETKCLTTRQPIHRINRGFVYADGFRFKWEDIATFDIFAGTRIEYCPGPKWAGTLPWPFYSTVTALLLAWRSNLPFHGSAVSIGGQGVLICGESGAGKSTLTAALIAEGAQFVSDDLSVVALRKDLPGWYLVKGRPGIRLFPEIGKWFFGEDAQPLPDDPRDKVIAVPANDADETLVPLRHVIFLHEGKGPISAIDRFILLRKSLFRPNWLGKLPSIAPIRVAVRDISAAAHVIVEPPIGETDEQSLRGRAKAIIDSVQKKKD